MVAVGAGAEGKKGKERRPGNQGKDIGGFRQPDLMPEKVHLYPALFLLPENIPGHGHQAAVLQAADALDGGKGGAAFLPHANDPYSGLPQLFLLQGLDPFLFLDPHVEKHLHIFFSLFQHLGRHFPVAEVGHEQDRSARGTCQQFLALAGQARHPAPAGQEPVHMDGGKALELVEDAPQVVEATSLWIESVIQAQAFPSPARTTEVGKGNDAGDQNKQGGAQQAATGMQYLIPETLHGLKLLRTRQKINREKVAELRMKSTQGRKWLIRSPFSW